MRAVRVGVVGVGNCAASLVQGVHYYRDAAVEDHVPGLMHVNFGNYHVADIQFVTAFDVDAKKVGIDLVEAIGASENNTIKLADVAPLGLRVRHGPTPRYARVRRLLSPDRQSLRLRPWQGSSRTAA
jgi:myo-inositol-1-phosphate synthase